MTDSSIIRPRGPTGPHLRAAVKTGTEQTKDPYVVESYPWRVDRSYQWGNSEWGSAAVLTTASWPWIFGLPAAALAGTAIVVTDLQIGVSNDGSGNSSSLLRSFGRCSLPTAGTVTTGADLALRGRSADAASVAEVRLASTATKGTVWEVAPYSSNSSHREFPMMYQSRRPHWLDTVVLVPGEYIGVKWEQNSLLQNPNGKERLFINLSWDEVTL